VSAQTAKTADEIALAIKVDVERMRSIGEYSTEARDILVLCEHLLVLAKKVVALENLARADLTHIIDAVAAGYRPPPVNERQQVIPLPEQPDDKFTQP
jgi:hypothetical protein